MPWSPEGKREFTRNCQPFRGFLVAVGAEGK
jgi:hypothetical protein